MELFSDIKKEATEEDTGNSSPNIPRSSSLKEFQGTSFTTTNTKLHQVEIRSEGNGQCVMTLLPLLPVTSNQAHEGC